MMKKTLIISILLIKYVLAETPTYDNNETMKEFCNDIYDGKLINLDLNDHYLPYVNGSCIYDFKPISIAVMRCNRFVYYGLKNHVDLYHHEYQESSLLHLLAHFSHTFDDKDMRKCSDIWNDLLKYFNIYYEDKCGNTALDYLVPSGRNIINQHNYYFEHSRNQLLIDAFTYQNDKAPWDSITLKQPTRCNYLKGTTMSIFY